MSQACPDVCETEATFILEAIGKNNKKDDNGKLRKQKWKKPADKSERNETPSPIYNNSRNGTSRSYASDSGTVESAVGFGSCYYGLILLLSFSLRF